MGTYESSYKSLLQGVSQQIARERQPGQVSAQENMLSDVVTNVRRRPGAEYKFSLVSAGADASNIKAYYTDIAGVNVHVLVNTSLGTITIMDVAYNVLASITSAYLVATSGAQVQATTVGDEFFLLNKGVQPVATGSNTGIDPKRRGAFFITAGAFSRTYTVNIATATGSVAASYTTPTGAGTGDAALSTPTYIATQLQAGITAVMAAQGIEVCTRVESYVYVQAVGATITVNSNTGTSYIIPSKDGYFTVEGNLPAQLPVEANGWIVRVGDLRTPKYFAYNSTTTAWLESGDYTSPTELTNMPISITKEGEVWMLSTAKFEGRLAGDDETNPNPRFTTYKITGMGSYQGRLVLLSGPQVLLSASNKPRRFYRSTVTTVLASDTIAVGSSANSSAAYEYAVPFQKDLLLFSAKYQALIPAGNVAITPSTATCVLTSAYVSDMASGPVQLGRTLMYPAPRSEDFFGVLEMIPSTSVDSQYTSADATAHLPKYMGGHCRFSVSSSNANMALFAPSKDTQSLIVHEYMWDGDTKVQQAWHRWTFPYPVAAAYFAGETIILVFTNNGHVLGASIDPRVGVLTFADGRKPFLDLHSASTIVDRVVPIPVWLLEFDPSIHTKLSMQVRSGDLAGEKVGFTVVGNNLNTVPSFSSGPVSMGVAYTSALSPTPPVVKDFNDVVISTDKSTLLRYIWGTANSSEYRVLVRDAQSAMADEQSVGTLYWSSSELAPGRATYATESSAVVPCRTNTNTTTVVAYTAGFGEFNVISIEYVLKFNLKIKRMEGRFR